MGNRGFLPAPPTLLHFPPYRGDADSAVGLVGCSQEREEPPTGPVTVVAEYHEGGTYADPIYEGFIMDPACPIDPLLFGESIRSFYIRLEPGRFLAEQLDQEMSEGSVFYFHQLPADHEAIQFARANNPSFDEILAGGNH